MRLLSTACLCLTLAGCGAVYQSPRIGGEGAGAADVQIVPITAQSVEVANRSAYRPQALPPAFSATAGGNGTLRGAGALPEPAFEREARPAVLETRLPPEPPAGPYRIGIGDVVLVATPQTGATVEELSGLLAAQSRRQGYTVQDDGAIAIPDVGRVPLSGLTLEEAEAALFQRLVENQIDPSFSLEIAEFNSQKVSIGGAVRNPAVIPLTLMPLYLDAALAGAGGVTVRDSDYASVRIYRDGTLYQIPLSVLYAQSGLKRIRLTDGDSIFVDAAYEIDQATAYFEEQIRLAEFRQRARQNALAELQAEAAIRRAELDEARGNYLARLELDAVARDYVYLAGEVGRQGRYPLPVGRTASLADALFEQGGIPIETGNVAEIYVLRGAEDPQAPGQVTAWNLDARNAGNLVLATRFELRPNDVIFVAEQQITRWGRVIQQITPSLISAGAAVATN